MGLPLLGNFAIQLVYALSENPGLGQADDGTATDSRRIYRLLRSAFHDTRKLFSEQAGILSTDELEIKEAGDQETIQMANMATIASSIFESDDDISLTDAHDNFLSSFLTDPEALDKDLADLFVNLKYCMLAAELVRLPDDEKRREFVERLFPVNLQEQLQNLHVDTPITDYEKVFLKDIVDVKEKMLEAVKTEESRQQLQNHFSLDGFRDELRDYLRANEDIVLRYADSHGIEMPGDDDANGDDSEMAADQAEPSIINGTDFTAMGNSIASMLSAAMASSDALAATAASQASAQQAAAPAATNGPTPMVIDSVNGVSDRSALEASPMAEGVSRLIQEAVQRSAARTSSQPPAASPQASTLGLLATPSIRTHTTAPPPNGIAAAPPAPTESMMDLTGLTKLIQDKLGQEAQEAQAPPASAPTLAPTPAYNMQQQTQSPVAQANAALSSMQNTFANNLAMYNRAPAFPYQQVQAPPPPPPQQQQVNTLNGGNPALPPHQSSPSAILYQQARQAAASKTQGHTRREGLHSTRRPWSPDEEQALMAGLDMVKGPHWSQILQLFGANGSLSDILKDRSQVQLKDKARNLKLFFLKANTEMPYYLKCVTGELKTRAPSQAARKEAEERAKATNKEEQARVQGIMTLAGGLQDNSNKMQNQNTAAPVTAHAPAHAPSYAPTHAPAHNVTAGHAPVVHHHNGMANGNVNVNNAVPINGAARPVAAAAPTGPPNGMQNGGATNGAVRTGAPTTLHNLAPNPPVSNLPPRIASATQLSPAVQQQLQQLQQQRQMQQTQLPPRQTTGTATTGTTIGTGAGAGATGVPQRTPVTAADVALAAARGGYSATAQALAAQQANGSAAGRPLLASGALSRASLGTTSASIKSVTADLTAGMTAAINNAINNAAIAARPTSTMLTSAQRLAAGRPSSISPSRSLPQQQQHRPAQSSPSPIRNLAPQSPAVAQEAAARPVQATASPARPSPAPTYAQPSPNVTAQPMRSPATLAGTPKASAHATPQPQSHPSTTVLAPAAAPTTAAPVVQATTTASTTAPAKALVAAPLPTPAAAPVTTQAPATTQPPAQAPAPAAPQQPEDRLWMLQQHIHTEAPRTTPAAAAAPANGAANAAMKPAPAPAPAVPTPAATAPTPTTTTPAPVAAPPATPANVPTPSPVPVVKAPPPNPQQQQQQQKQEQQEDASEESVLARLLASPPN
ncbi:TTAGGG repeat binding factor [Sporothrix stenoceras]|uniref:TTAGGG repeat binding factor n=1 Tax=Sporothrix stenoceras TaxID=5173 RepID=A0ABR3ZLM7_9PEZI